MALAALRPRCLVAVCLVLLCRWTASLCSFVASALEATPSRSPSMLRRASIKDLAGADMSAMEEMMKDPEKVKQMQAEVDALMKDPEKRKAMEEYQKMAQQAAEALKDDPELQDFFEDVKKNGLSVMEKYQNDERILEKFSQATGGPQAWMSRINPGMPGPAAAAAPKYKPGDEVIIRGLSKAPELNGKKAMVVPPTADEKKTLEGTTRLIVRLIDSGDQYAVKPENLRTTQEEANELMGSELEDVSIYNPALQSEAAKLRESGKLDDLQNDPELAPVFKDIKENGMGALEKYWSDEKLMAKISKAMGG